MPAPSFVLDIGKFTHIGQVRKRNEDSFQIYNVNHAAGQLFIVADGVGGESRGDEASQYAVKRIGELYYQFAERYPNNAAEELLRRALRQTNGEIYSMAEKYGVAGHMGTTGVAAVLRGNTLALCWAGDSRAYIVDSNKKVARQITFDHTQLEEEIRAGIITRQQAAMMPEKNYLSRSLGGRPTVDPETRVGEVREGDFIVICSDGMSRYLQEAQITSMCLEAATAQQAAENMGMRAYHAGGKDNITVIVVRLGQPSEQTAEAPVIAGMEPTVDSEGETLIDTLPTQALSSHTNRTLYYALSAFIVVLIIVVIGLMVVLVNSRVLTPTPEATTFVEATKPEVTINEPASVLQHSSTLTMEAHPTVTPSSLRTPVATYTALPTPSLTPNLLVFSTNTLTPDFADTDIAAANLQTTPATVVITHVVKSGDTLIGIANCYGVKIDDIATQNSIKDQNKIFPGTPFIIPNPTITSAGGLCSPASISDATATAAFITASRATAVFNLTATAKAGEATEESSQGGG